MRWKLGLLFLAVILVPFAIALQLIVAIVEQGMNRSLVERVDASAELAVNLVERSFRRLHERAASIANSKRIRDSVYEGDELSLIAVLEEMRQEQNLTLFGGVIEVLAPDGEILAVVPPRRGNELAGDSRAFARALARQMPLILSREEELVKVTAAHPIYHESQADPLAALALTFWTNDSFADQIKKLVKANIVIFARRDEQCRVIASSIFDGGKRLRPEIPKKLSPSSIFSFASRSYCVRTRAVETKDGFFFVAVLHDRETLESTLRSVRATLLIIGFITATLALIIAFAFSKRVIVNPINRLVESAERLGEGNFDEAVSMDCKDEFSFLAKTFDEMRGRIKATLEELDDKISELSMMDTINKAIIKNSGRPLLRRVLELVSGSLKAEHASIMMVVEKEDGTRVLQLKEVFLAKKQAQKSIKVKDYVSLSFGEGLAGRAAMHKQPLYSNELSLDDRFKPYGEGFSQEIALRNLLCVPLLGEQQVLGVINVANCEREIDSLSAKLVQLIADQVAIALMKARLYEDAISDGMTGLYIQKYFRARLETELQRARRYGSSLSLIMLDIDHFKSFNDNYGHQLGDKVIANVASVIRDNHREGVEIAARYGGEEFAIILPESCLSDALEVAERLRQRVEDSVVLGDGEVLKVSISLGCAQFPEDADTASELIDKADNALYHSKRKGRNRVSAAGEQ